MLTSFIEMMSYDFIVRAFFCGLIISICAALIGSSLVLRNRSMIGDGLSHVAFGATAIAVVLGLAPLEFSIPIVILASFLILRINKFYHIGSDAVIAVLSASALALGTFLISIKKGVNIDLNSYLFGSILSLSIKDIYFSVALGVIVITLFILFRRQIFAITFDENFASAIGINVKFYNVVLAILSSLTIVIGMKLLGALLVSSLIIFPCLTAMNLSRTFRSNTIIAVIISIICFVFGLTLSYMLEAPTGATIVLVNLIALAISTVYNKLK